MAGVHCHSVGKKLPSILSQADQDLLVKTIVGAGLEKEHFWTAGTCLGNDRKFYWMDTGKVFSYTKWFPGQPDNDSSSPEPEDCVEVYQKDEWAWNDIRCAVKLSVVCEE